MINKTAAFIGAVLLLLTSFSACAQGSSSNTQGQIGGGRAYKEGVHYKLLSLPIRPTDPSKIEVMELFSYACIHCYRFEPYMKIWLKRKPDDVSLLRTPAVFGRHDWYRFAQTYYTLQELGLLEKAHEAFFDAIHKKNLDFSTPDLIAEFFTQFKVSKEKFLTSYNSFSVNSKLAQARTRIVTYEIAGVPTIVVAGKYQIQNNKLGKPSEIMQLTDFLIRQERKLRLSGK